MFVRIHENDQKKENQTTLKVGASTTRHAQILEAAKPVMIEKSYKLEIVEFTDYILPNVALQEGDIDANFF